VNGVMFVTGPAGQLIYADKITASHPTAGTYVLVDNQGPKARHAERCMGVGQQQRGWSRWLGNQPPRRLDYQIMAAAGQRTRVMAGTKCDAIAV
jgi:hypothetical protein